MQLIIPNISHNAGHIPTIGHTSSHPDPIPLKQLCPPVHKPKISNEGPPYVQFEDSTYYGGKGAAGVHQKIINQIPPHDVFLSGCLGQCYITKMKRPASLTIGIDRNKKIIDIWKAAEYPEGVLQPGKNLQLLCADIIQELKRISSLYNNLFIYFDPPYPKGSRSDPRDRYEIEMSDSQHIELLEQCQYIPHPIAISTYQNPIYSRMLSGWRCIDFCAMSRGGKRRELLYMNYDMPAALHDYSFLGENFSKRQKIKEKLSNMERKIRDLSPLMRSALLDRLADLNTKK